MKQEILYSTKKVKGGFVIHHHFHHHFIISGHRDRGDPLSQIFWSLKYIRFRLILSSMV